MDHSIPVELSSELMAGNVVAFVGAGLSIGSGLPGWYNITRNLVSRISYPLPPEEWTSGEVLIDAIQNYINNKGLNSVIAYLKETLGDINTKHNDSHAALANLPIPMVFTANFDNLLERAYQAEGRNVHVVVQDIDVPFMTHKSGVVNIVKMYGDLAQPKSLVFARQQYEEYFVHRPQLTKLFETEIAKSTVLYLGWSHKDPYFNMIFGDLLARMGGLMRRGYAVAFDIQSAQVVELARKNIEVIPLPSIPDRTIRLSEWLNGLVKLVTTNNNKTALSSNRAIDYKSSENVHLRQLLDRLNINRRQIEMDLAIYAIGEAPLHLRNQLEEIKKQISAIESRLQEEI
jgi:hypothetical protein